MRGFLSFCVLLSYLGLAQEPLSNKRIKTIAIKDSISIDTVSINPSRFLVKTKSGVTIDSTFYTIDFKTATLRLKTSIPSDSLVIEYLRYPNFLTKDYKQLDPSIIVENTAGLQRLYKLNQNTTRQPLKLLEGLNTSGSIARGVTIGNNQNSVLNSELDLQISGKLSDKVTLRASIQDANIPLQESGYSQRLDEFDQVFIELLSEDWNIRAGDIDLVNTNSYFGNFSKRVQGLMVNANLGEHTKVFASGSLVRGQFTSSQFTAEEGNQGPYKLRGPNNELFVLIVSGSETVYVNGVPLQRGENHDYIIDYNAGEIIFNSTFPITSEMRITVDYQFSERNYSRFTVFGGAQYDTEKLKLNFSVYSESDAKNQPLQQNLSNDQIEILSLAGDDSSLMNAPSAVSESFSENRILYRKEIVGGEEIFVFSNDPNDTLFSVRFTLVGDNQGDYVLSNDNTVSNIYEYVAPVGGVPQGNYAPIIRLTPPERLQIATLNGTYTPTEKTKVFFELAGSKNDLNLFSNLNDDDNDGYAAKLKVEQQLIKRDSSWNVFADFDADYIQRNFRTIQRLYRPEFNRDWNINQAENDLAISDFGNQLLASSSLRLFHHKKGGVNYNFEHLNYSENFNANRHNLNVNLRFKNVTLFSNSSYLSNKNSINDSKFLRSFNRVVYGKKNKWAGAKFATEDNEQIDNSTQLLTNLSQRFSSYETFVGIGDSTKVFAEVGFNQRFNDSLRNNLVERVNTSNTFYLKSQLIKNKNTNLRLFVNFRDLKPVDDDIPNEQSINSRLNFNQKLFDNVLFLNTSFETNSGTLPQQDFTFVEVEAGQGVYTWIDYNNNSIQELNEFEIAQFQDQGNYIRVLLPNQIFVSTHQNRLSQTLTFNPQKWASSKKKVAVFWSHFYNQTALLLDQKLRRDGNAFNLNPFKNDEENQLGLNNSIRNVLFYNRGKQKYTTSYTFLNNRSRNVLSIGFQENKLFSHQIEFNHKIGESWLFNTTGMYAENESLSENFSNRNFNIKNRSAQPKLSYLFSENAQFDVFYKFSSQQNLLAFETLEQQNYGVSFIYNKAQKLSLNGAFNYFNNAFSGNPNSPVAYQMLEGLQPGSNFTWNLLLQKKITKFLDLNLSYFGRKTETSKAIHTGTVQLKAYF